MQDENFRKFWERVSSDGQPRSTLNGVTLGEMPKLGSMSEPVLGEILRESPEPWFLLSRDDLHWLSSLGIGW